MVVQDVVWERVDTESTGDYTFFYENVNVIFWVSLRDGLLGVGYEEAVGVLMFGCGVVVLRTEDISDDTKNCFYEELDHTFE